MRISREGILKFSLQQILTGFFHDTSIFGTAFNVYGETQFRSKTFAPAVPYVYILDSQVNFKDTHLPMVVIESQGTDPRAFELGGPAMFVIEFNLHVFGATRTVRDEIGSLIAETVLAIPLTDPVTLTTPLTTSGSEMVALILPWRDETFWISETIRVGSDPETFESSLTNWKMLRSRVLMN